MAVPPAARTAPDSGTRSTAPSCERLSSAPIMRATHTALREALARHGDSFTNLKRAVAADPACAVNLFSAVNPMLAQHGKRSAADIQRALLYLGMAALPGWIERLPVLEESVDPAFVATAMARLRDAHYATHQARAIAALKGGLSGDEIAAAALVAGGLEYIDTLGESPGCTLTRDRFAHAAPGAPEHPDAAHAGSISVELAARFAGATGVSWNETALDPLYEEIATFTGRDAALVGTRLRYAVVEAARAGIVYGAYPPIVGLMAAGLPAGTLASGTTANTPRTSATGPVRPPAPAAEKQARTPARKANPPSARPQKAVPRTPPKAASAPKPAAQRTPAPSAQARTGTPRAALSTSVEGALTDLLRSGREGQPATALIPQALCTICDHAGMGIAVLLLRERQSNALVLRAHQGLALPPALDLRFAPGALPLLDRLLERNAALHWLAHRHAAHLSGAAADLLAGEDGFLSGLALDGQPLGIVIAARPQSAHDTPARFTVFKQICGATSRALTLSRQHAADARS